ncbi:MAG: site-specific integrase [Thiohalocapsa sp.]
MELHDTHGKRLYLTADERAAFLAAAKNADLPVRTFCLVLHYTGCRISEALALTPAGVDLSGKTIVFETLKKRRRGVYRAVPVPEAVLDTLNMVHGLQGAGKRRRRATDRTPLWNWSRTTAWRRVKAVLDAASIADGPHKSPKGLRHGYGVQAVSTGVPPNMLKKWMGHASLAVTAIYSDALGEEQHRIAARMWE